MNLQSIYTSFTNRFLWWVFVSTYFLFVYMPRLLMEGMFGDGLTYASIARNMAIGEGTFWAPYFSSSFWLAYNKTEVFYEHPPLAMYFQSLLFKVFGDQLFVEKLYCLMVCGLTIWAISLLWRTVFSESNFKDWDWLPTVIWLGMPEVEWSVANNMLDNTQTMFCICAAYFCFISLKNGQKSWMAIVSGASIFLGILSKGPVSLFVVAVPWIYWLIMDRKTKVFQISFYQIMGLGVPLVYCILDSDAYNFLSKYIQQQFLSAILGNREITEGGSDLKAHLHIFSAIYTQISPGLVLLLLGVVWLLGKRGVQVVRSFSPNQTFRVAWFFFILAMSGSFPIALSVKQADYYLLPSSPFYALGLGVSFVYFMEKLQLTTWQIIPKIWHLAIISLVFFVSIGFSAGFIGEVRKYEKDIIHDLPMLHTHIPDASKIWVCPDMMRDFNIHSYLQRYYRYELTESTKETDFFLVQSGCHPPDGLDLVKVEEPLERFSLYERKK